jgi:hypothetical protein
MLAKILNSSIIKYPYLWDDFQIDNNNTNYGNILISIESIFPLTKMAEEGYSVVEIKKSQRPDCNLANQIVNEGVPEFINGIWTQTWVISAMPQEDINYVNEAQKANVRNQRNNKLIESDWTQVADSPVDKNVWAAYRQALRDVTNQKGFPWTIDWPTI